MSPICERKRISECLRVCAFLQIFAKLNSFGKTLTVRREGKREKEKIRNRENGCFVARTFNSLKNLNFV